LDDGFFSLAPSLPPVGALVVLQHAVGKVACVVNVQLSQQANLREIPPHEHNLRELLMITQWLERVSAQPAAPTYLLCGTFNSLPEGYVYRFLTDGSPGDGSPVTHALSLASAVREKLQSEQPNMTNDKAQRIALDYIFFSRQSLAVRDCEIAPDPKAIVAIRSAPLMRPYHQFVSASFHFIS
jgi:endonuclease/exonuclease/phosphatase family metal-dependent hydrolase